MPAYPLAGITAEHSGLSAFSGAVHRNTPKKRKEIANMKRVIAALFLALTLSALCVCRPALAETRQQ